MRAQTTSALLASIDQMLGRAPSVQRAHMKMSTRIGKGLEEDSWARHTIVHLYMEVLQSAPDTKLCMTRIGSQLIPEVL